MYAWIWYHLPEPLALRLVLTLVLVAAVVALLMLVVFPAVENMLPMADVTTG